MQSGSPSQRGMYYLVFLFQILLVIIAAKLWRGSYDPPAPQVAVESPAASAERAERNPWPSANASSSAEAPSFIVAVATSNQPFEMTADAPLEPLEDPFAAAADPFESLEDPFAAAADPFESLEDPFAAADDPFESLEDPFANAADPFEPLEDPFATAADPFESLDDPFAAADDPLNTAQDPFAARVTAESAPDPPFAASQDGFTDLGEPITPVATAPGPAPSSSSEAVNPLASKTPVPPPTFSLAKATPSRPTLPRPMSRPSMPRQSLSPQPLSPQSLSPQPSGAVESLETLAPPPSRPPVVSPWSTPAAMVAPLQELAEFPEFEPWSVAVRRSLGEILRSPTLTDDRLAKSFSDLEQLGRQEIRLDGSPSAALQRQQAYAVRRRVGLWKAVYEASLRVDPNRAYSDPAWLADRCESMIASLDALEIALDERQSGNAWRQVFQVQALRDSAERCSPSDLSAQHQLARQVLDELDAMKRFRGAHAVWELPAIVQFTECLHVWAVEPLVVSELMATLEGFELRPDQLAARDLARTTRGLLASDQDAHRKIGTYLDTHYRNANLRLVLSDELINRFLPTIPATVRPVRDSMFGAQISGQSRNTTRLSLRAVPDSDAWNLRLNAQGKVSSQTTARKGPVLTYDQGQSEFAASKPVVIDQTGVHLGRTEVAADGQTRLRGLETRLDKIPILGLVVRRLAREEHAKKSPKARKLFASRVAGQVRGEVDQKIRNQLEQAQQAYAQRVQQPLDDLALDPRSLQLSTTADQKLMVRYRVAAHNQLGAYTARPRALADSLMSLQIHESTLNNMVEQLGLAGRRIELSQLVQEIADKMQLADFEVPQELPEDVILKFAASEPLRVEFHDGRMTVRIRLAELTASRRRWRNFEARAHYVPQVRGVQVALQRVDSVQLLGRRLSFRDQVALRGVFTKVFSKNRELPLLQPQVVEHPALAQTRLSQLEIRDGWLGLSLSDAPPATASRPTPDRDRR